MMLHRKYFLLLEKRQKYSQENKHIVDLVKVTERVLIHFFLLFETSNTSIECQQRISQPFILCSGWIFYIVFHHEEEKCQLAASLLPSVELLCDCSRCECLARPCKASSSPKLLYLKSVQTMPVCLSISD